MHAKKQKPAKKALQTRQQILATTAKTKQKTKNAGYFIGREGEGEEKMASN